MEFTPGKYRMANGEMVITPDALLKLGFTAEDDTQHPHRVHGYVLVVRKPDASIGDKGLKIRLFEMGEYDWWFEHGAVDLAWHEQGDGGVTLELQTMHDVHALLRMLGAIAAEKARTA